MQVQRGTVDAPAGLRAARQAFPFLEMLTRWAWRCKISPEEEATAGKRKKPVTKSFGKKKLKRKQEAENAAAAAASAAADLGAGAAARDGQEVRADSSSRWDEGWGLEGGCCRSSLIFVDQAPSTLRSFGKPPFFFFFFFFVFVMPPQETVIELQVGFDVPYLREVGL